MRAYQGGGGGGPNSFSGAAPLSGSYVGSQQSSLPPTVQTNSYNASNYNSSYSRGAATNRQVETFPEMFLVDAPERLIFEFISKFIIFTFCPLGGIAPTPMAASRSLINPTTATAAAAAALFLQQAQPPRRLSRSTSSHRQRLQQRLLLSSLHLR